MLAASTLQRTLASFYASGADPSTWRTVRTERARIDHRAYVDRNAKREQYRLYLEAHSRIAEEKQRQWERIVGYDPDLCCIPTVSQLTIRRPHYDIYRPLPHPTGFESYDGITYGWLASRLERAATPPSPWRPSEPSTLDENGETTPADVAAANTEKHVRRCLHKRLRQKGSYLQPADAEELTQEALSKVLLALEPREEVIDGLSVVVSPDYSESFGALVWAVVRSTYAEWCKYQVRFRSEPEPLEKLVHDDRGGLTPDEQLDRLAALIAAIGNDRPELQKTALELSRGQTQTSTAEILGISRRELGRRREAIARRLLPVVFPARDTPPRVDLRPTQHAKHTWTPQLTTKRRVSRWSE